MKAAERQEQMKQYIQAADRVTVAELSGHWGITEETVRRDLDKLESQGSVTRVHGGAIWNGFVDTGGEHFVRRHKINAREKGYIALKAAEVIHPCETIIADASSTVLEALKAVGDERRLTVITNSSKICDGSFEPAYNLICTGGIYNWKSLSFQGESALESIRKYRVDLAILGCKALDLDLGVMDSYDHTPVTELATCQLVASATYVIAEGLTGTGKGHLARALGKRACKRGLKTLYVRMPDMLVYRTERMSAG